MHICVGSEKHGYILLDSGDLDYVFSGWVRHIVVAISSEDILTTIYWVVLAHGTGTCSESYDLLEGVFYWKLYICIIVLNNFILDIKGIKARVSRNKYVNICFTRVFGERRNLWDKGNLHIWVGSEKPGYILLDSGDLDYVFSG